MLSLSVNLSEHHVCITFKKNLTCYWLQKGHYDSITDIIHVACLFRTLEPPHSAGAPVPGQKTGGAGQNNGGSDQNAGESDQTAGGVDNSEETQEQQEGETFVPGIHYSYNKHKRF